MKTLLALSIFLYSSILNAQQPSVQLTWQDNANNESGFGIEKNFNGSPFTLLISLVGADLVSYTDFAVQVPVVIGGNSNIYCYRVYAFNAAGNSGYSNSSCKSFAPPTQQPPTAPSNLQTSSIGSTSVTLSWKDNATNEKAQELKITQDSPAKSWDLPVMANVKVFQVAGLNKWTTYRFKVRAIGDPTPSAYSNEVKAKTHK